MRLKKWPDARYGPAKGAHQPGLEANPQRSEVQEALKRSAIAKGPMPENRRFPPPWTVDEANNACFIVRDSTVQALGYFYFEEEPADDQRPSCSPRMRRDDWRSTSLSCLSCYSALRTTSIAD
jgi:hypothetical protein